ncbi:6-phosphofructokinase [Mesomycoplasma moatsii]|uniref:6-phosphofructokinase n=1 Tax=Mesomycoplasma moatsii TaxID=171287 RepID=UPI0003B5493A
MALKKKKNEKKLPIRKVAILTSGGDAPGMNSAIRAIVKAAMWKGLEPYLVYEGYKGLTEGNIKPASNVNVDRFINQGGTFIYSARYPEFKDEKVRLKAKKQLDKMGIEALIVIGGDGSYHGAQLLHTIGVRTIGLPGTIDNDISSSDYTIGFFSALETIVQNVDRIRDTSRSHHRCMIVEVMGRFAGDLATHSGIATGAELIITSEKKYSIKEIIDIVDQQMNKNKKESMIIVVAEHLYDNLDKIAKEIEQKTNVVTRSIVLSQVQRGGAPTGFERYVATQMGTYAIELLCENKSGLAIGFVRNQLVAEPILEALTKPRPKYLEITEKYSKINQE